MQDEELADLKQAIEGLTAAIDRMMQEPPIEKITKDEIRAYRKVCRILEPPPPPGEIIHVCWPPPPPPPIPKWWWRRLLEQLEQQLEQE